MVVESEQDRIRQLLSRALPLLCKSGLSFANEFSIEALIGITLDKSDVFLVSVKETFSCQGDVVESDHISNATLEMTVSNGANNSPSESPVHFKRSRKRKSEPTKFEIENLERGNASIKFTFASTFCKGLC